MTIEEVKKAIEARGFTVEVKQTGERVQLEVKKGDQLIPWPAFSTGKSGNVASVELRSYHPVKVPGMNEHSVVAVYGDVYMANLGRPSAADKAVAALLAAPKAEKEEAPAEVVVETGRKGRRQHAAA